MLKQDQAVNLCFVEPILNSYDKTGICVPYWAC